MLKTVMTNTKSQEAELNSVFGKKPCMNSKGKQIYVVYLSLNIKADYSQRCPCFSAG